MFGSATILRFLLSAVLVAAGAVAASPRAASAVTLRTFKVGIDPPKTDRFQIAGSFEALALDGASQVILEAELLPLAVPLSAFTRKRDRLTFRAPRGSSGVQVFTIDLKRKKFGVSGKGVVLSGLASPLAVRFGTDIATECTIATLADSALKPRKVKPGKRPKRMLKLRRKQDAAMPCDLPEPPRTDPTVVIAGVPASLRVTIALPPAPPPDVNGVRLLRRGVSGAAIGDTLCVMNDDAADGDFRAGDHTATCTVALSEVAPGSIPLVVTASFGGAPRISPGLDLPVVDEITEGDHEALEDMNARAIVIWQQNEATLGDGLEARVATVRALRVLAGVADAGVAANGLDIVFLMTSGLSGGLMLSPRLAGEPAPLDSPAAPTTGRAANGSFPAVGLPTADAPHGIDPRAIACEERKPRHLIGNTKVFIFDPAHFTPSEATFVEDKVKSACPFGPDDLVYEFGANARVPTLFPLAQYGTVVIVSHGFADWNDRSAFLTGQAITPESAPFLRADLEKGRLLSVRTNLFPDVSIVAVAPSFIENLPGTFQDALVYGGFCHSSFNGSMQAAFIAKGAKAYFGYSNAVSNYFAARTGILIFDRMIMRLQTTGETDGGLSPRVDPVPRPTTALGAITIRPKAAEIQLAGDKDLAYVGAPNLTPDAASIVAGDEVDLETVVERGETCKLTYAWETDGIVGNLSDGENEGLSFESDSKDATYATPIDAAGGRDEVRVEVRVDQEGDGDPIPFGRDCSTIDVRCRPGAAAARGMPDECPLPNLPLRITFAGKSKSREQSPPRQSSATVTWRATYTVTLPDLNGEGNAFRDPAGPGSTVEGPSTYADGIDSCAGPIVVNTSHGQPNPPPEAESPFIGLIDDPSLVGTGSVRLYFDTMGGYDYRVCNGILNIGVGPLPGPLPGYPTYAPAIGFAETTITFADWVGVGPHTQLIEGLSGTASASAGSASADACWNGVIQLTTAEGAPLPDPAGIPAPTCF